MIKIYKNGEFVPLEGKTLYGHTFKNTDRIYANNKWYICSDLIFDKSLYASSITISGATPAFLNGTYPLVNPDQVNPCYQMDITGQYEEFSQYDRIECELFYDENRGFWRIILGGTLADTDDWISLYRRYYYTSFDFLTNENPIWYCDILGESLDFTVTKNY
ncbi:MAG: hypothetical protein IJW31_00690 [Lentisphaeria bacterium]|nr:hypothetical protein [Lentisphaeria bacterium]